MPNPSYKDIKVLVIDDQPFIRNVVTQLLRQIGFSEISHAEDGATGLKAVERFHPDLVVCDIEMEPVDGIGFLQGLRERPDSQHAAIPVIFLTRHAEADLVKRAKALGVNAFVLKPPNLKSLKERVDFVLLHA